MILHLTVFNRFTGKPAYEFWWSREQGLTSSATEELYWLYLSGINPPPDGEQLYPADGERFFRALPWHYGGTLMSAGEVKEVDVQGGEALVDPPAPGPVLDYPIAE